MWLVSSCQVLRDTVDNLRQGMTIAHPYAQVLMTVQDGAEASVPEVEAPSVQVLHPLIDTLTCTEAAGLQVNELASGANRPREEVATTQHAAGASSEALPEGALPAQMLHKASIPTATDDAAVVVPHRYITRATFVDAARASTRAEDALPRKMPRTDTPRQIPRILLPSRDFESHDFVSMDVQNTWVLTQDKPTTWHNGIKRFRISASSAAEMLSWVVENTSRTLSTITAGTLCLNGFHNWDAVHSQTHNALRQQQHTFVISRTQRKRALKTIPELNNIVATVQAEIVSMYLHDTPERLEWLTAHILNQGDINARFTYHQDTTEERDAPGGRCDRHVLYTAIIKLNRGGCTSMRVCGQPEVFYLAPAGTGVIFRSDLHHRTEKAEPGIWKIALFFGVFL